MHKIIRSPPGSIAHWENIRGHKRTVTQRQQMWESATRELAMQSSNKRSRTDAQDGADEVGKGREITNPPPAVPNQWNEAYTVKLPYVDSINLTTTYGANQNYIFRMNSLFDPDYTGTGHQPKGRDLWASMYDYYAVLACNYKFTCYNASDDSITYTAAGTNAQKPTCVAITLIPTTNVTDVTTPTSLGMAAEMKNSITKIITPNKDPVVLTGTLTPGDFLVDASSEDSDGVWTANGSNHAVPRYLGINTSFLATGAFTGQNEQPYALVQIMVELEYVVQFCQVNSSLRQASS